MCLKLFFYKNEEGKDKRKSNQIQQVKPIFWQNSDNRKGQPAVKEISKRGKSHNRV